MGDAPTTIATYPSLVGKCVLITGGGSGIGEALTTRFAEQGAKVGFLDIAETPSRALEKRLNEEGHAVKFVHCDIIDTDALRSAIGTVRNAFGPIGVLINNAANDERHKLEDITPDYWDERIAINLKHQFFASQAIVDDMKSLSGGSIINMGSIAWMLSQGGMACYTTSKSAVLGLTRSLARDLGEFNIRVNSIAPGWIMTERQKTLWLTPKDEEEIFTNQCLKRFLQPDDIARPALFLASNEAGAITNQTHIVDGGWI